MMTHLLERFPAGLFDITLFEATPRLGGKVLTQRFNTIPAIYEAGVAELYDYSHIGLDPLKTLVQDLGLKPVPMHGHVVVLGDEILRSEHDARVGPKSRAAASDRVAIVARELPIYDCPMGM